MHALTSMISLPRFVTRGRRLGTLDRPRTLLHPRVTLSTRHRSLRVQADSGTPSSEPEKETEYVPPENEPTLAGKIFGSYLQLGVWIVVLGFAGYKGIQQAQTDPSSVGLLLAPPAGALFLIVSFLIYRFWGKDDGDARDT